MVVASKKKKYPAFHQHLT